MINKIKIEDFTLFKIILKAKKVPIISNPIIKYEEDINRQTNHLYCGAACRLLKTTYNLS
jgi:hypothetical protein